MLVLSCIHLILYLFYKPFYICIFIILYPSCISFFFMHLIFIVHPFYCLVSLNFIVSFPPCVNFILLPYLSLRLISLRHPFSIFDSGLEGLSTCVGSTQLLLDHFTISLFKRTLLNPWIYPYLFKRIPSCHDLGG